MQKDFIDELVDGLLELKETKKISVPVPPAPHEVIEVLLKVADKHKITAEELSLMLSVRGGVTQTEIEVLKSLEDKE